MLAGLWRSRSAITASSASRLAWMSETIAWTTLTPLPRAARRSGDGSSELLGTQLAGDPVEHAVHEAARLLGAEPLGERDRLVEHHPHRHAGACDQLGGRTAQHRTIGGGEPVQLPVLGGFLQQRVDLGALLRDRADDVLDQ